LASKAAVEHPGRAPVSSAAKADHAGRPLAMLVFNETFAPVRFSNEHDVETYPKLTLTVVWSPDLFVTC
jgi:hypothetical protein